jgi:hypothetical protein
VDPEIDLSGSGRPPNLPPEVLRRSTITDIPSEDKACDGGCGKVFGIGDTCFYRLKPPQVFCSNCGDSARTAL